MAHPPFAYYPEQSRQQPHLTSHPSVYGHLQYQPSQRCVPDQQPIYTSQPMVNMHQMATTNAFRGAMNMTPIASPQPSHLKPAIFVQPGSPALMPIDTRFANHGDVYAFPSTPPLSTAGSSISSPPSTSGALRTPTNEAFFVEGVKEVCEGDVQSELLANADWSRTESPPMTPGMFCL